MDCREAILSDEYIDFVWKMDVRPPEAEWLPYGYCGQYISPNISVYYVRREEVFGNRISLPVGDYGVILLPYADGYGKSGGNPGF